MQPRMFEGIEERDEMRVAGMRCVGCLDNSQKLDFIIRSFCVAAGAFHDFESNMAVKAVQ